MLAGERVGRTGWATRGRVRSLEELPLAEARAEIAARLRARGPEIEETIFARVCDGRFGHVGDEDAEYVAGLRATVAAVVEFGLSGIEQGEESVGPVPPAALTQARRAARLGVHLDTVLRRYIAGHALLADFITEEVDRSGFSGNEAVLHHHLRRTQTPLLERITAAIVEEYNGELERVRRSPEQRRAELVLRLLAGKPLDPVGLVDLDYDFDAWHMGVIATGGSAAEALRGVKTALGCARLTVMQSEHTLWIWFGFRRKPTAREAQRMSLERPAGVLLATGEPRRGIDGWRLTHQEAQAALLIALRKPPGVTRCSDVLLEAAVLQHKTLATSLVETFLLPLEGLRYREHTARDTLRAYFEARRNVSSAANRLGVARNTFESRLREIEERLDRPLHTCSAQLEVALRLEVLSDAASADKPAPPWRVGCSGLPDWV
jgi:PucR C-terminal helix-turn-helix domain